MAHCGHCAKSCATRSPEETATLGHYDAGSATWSEGVCPACAQARTIVGRLNSLADQYRHTTLVAGTLRAAGRVVAEYLPDGTCDPAPDPEVTPPGHRGHCRHCSDACTTAAGGVRHAAAAATVSWADGWCPFCSAREETVSDAVDTLVARAGRYTHDQKVVDTYRDASDAVFALL